MHLQIPAAGNCDITAVQRWTYNTVCTLPSSTTLHHVSRGRYQLTTIETMVKNKQFYYYCYQAWFTPCRIPYECIILRIPNRGNKAVGNTLPIQVGAVAQQEFIQGERGERVQKQII